MAGTIKANQVQLGDSATATQNFTLRTNQDGTATLARGNVGATSQDILTVDANGRVATPQSVVAFRVFTGIGQSFPNTTFTKLTLATKGFDTTNAFDAVTNYRFQPPVAGYYQINGSISFAGAASGYTQVAIYRNGVAYATGSSTPLNTSTGGMTAVSDLVYFNGSTDYVELWVWQNSGGALGLLTGQGNYFSGILIAKA